MQSPAGSGLAPACAADSCCRHAAFPTHHNPVNLQVSEPRVAQIAELVTGHAYIRNA
jgi:hypothetical protein